MIVLAGTPSGFILLGLIAALLYWAWRAPDPEWLKRSWLGRSYHSVRGDSSLPQESDKPALEEGSWVQAYLHEKEAKKKPRKKRIKTVIAEEDQLEPEDLMADNRMSVLAPGWYPIGHADRVRYHDGKDWTSIIEDLPEDVDPRDFPPPVVPIAEEEPAPANET